MKFLYKASVLVGALFMHGAAFSMEWAVLRSKMDNVRFSPERLKMVDEIVDCEIKIAEDKNKISVFLNDTKIGELRESINNNIKKKNQLVESLIEDINAKSRAKLVEKITKPQPKL